LRIFVSHAWEDKPLALELARLADYIDVWVDVRELIAGQSLDPTIIRAIEDSHVFVVLISRTSIAKNWVVREVEWALDREAQKDRVFVLPVLIEAGIDLPSSPMPFADFAQRLYIDASDTSEAGLQRSRDKLRDTLFRWASDWLDRMEPEGDANRRFVEQLDRDLAEYRRLLFAVKATLDWPLPTLVQDQAVAHLIKVKDDYNAFTDPFIPRMGDLEAEIRWRFGVAAQRGFARLTTFIRNEVYHGAAFALNDVIESINSYETMLANNPSALAEAESRRQSLLRALEPVMAELTERTADYVDTLR
jgi:hypothetical protein